MHFNGISRYFEANFEASLLSPVLFLRVNFLSVLFFTFFTTLLIILSKECNFTQSLQFVLNFSETYLLAPLSKINSGSTTRAWPVPTPSSLRWETILIAIIQSFVIQNQFHPMIADLITTKIYSTRKETLLGWVPRSSSPLASSMLSSFLLTNRCTFPFYCKLILILFLSEMCHEVRKLDLRRVSGWRIL